jgi:hypothetical protein
MPSIQVETYDQIEKRSGSVPLASPGLDPQIAARAITLSSVNDRAPMGEDRFSQTVPANVFLETLVLGTGHRRE